MFHSFIDLRRFALSAVIACGMTGVGQAHANQGNLGFVLNSRDASVTVVSAADFKELKVLDTGKEPHHLMRTPDGTSLIVANAASNSMIFVDPNTGAVQRTLNNIDDPYQIGFSPDNKWFVVNCLRLNRVDVYSVSGQGVNKEFKLAKRIPMPRLPSHLVFSPDSKQVFITLQESGEIGAIDLDSMKATWRVKVGSAPAGIWMTPDNKHLLVGVMGRDYVSVVDWRTQKVVKEIKTGAGAHNFRPLGDGRHVFVTNRVANTLSLIDQQTLEKLYDIPVPGGPDCIDISADGKMLWVTSRWNKSVSVVDIAQRKVVRTIPVGRSPHGIFLTQSAPWK